MTRGEAIEIARQLLSDSSGSVFKDSMMNRYAERARKKYCEDTGFFVGKIQLYSDDKSRFRLPDDFIGPLFAIRADGQRIEISTSRLSIDGASEGKVESLFRDLDDDGFYKMSPPQPDDSQMISPGGYGIITQIHGLAFGEERGTVEEAFLHDEIGVLYYTRYAEWHEIKDKTSIAYGILAQCYSADSDFANSNFAEQYSRLFNQRCSVARINRKSNAFSVRVGQYL